MAIRKPEQPVGSDAFEQRRYAGGRLAERLTDVSIYRCCTDAAAAADDVAVMHESSLHRHRYMHAGMQAYAQTHTHAAFTATMRPADLLHQLVGLALWSEHQLLEDSNLRTIPKQL